MIQIDMEMPKSCLDCKFYFRTVCPITNKTVSKDVLNNTLHKDCPLKEVSVGRWIKLENWMDVGIRVKCSECGQVFVLGDRVSRNYCGNCGSKMDKEIVNGSNNT